MSSHNTTIKDYNSAKELAIDLSNLRYDVLAEILKELSKKLEMVLRVILGRWIKHYLPVSVAP
jgi:hypothetical protein